MNTLLLGNIVAFVGCGLMVLIGLVKEKKKILYAQILQFLFMGSANLILGGITGAITNLASIVRNIVFSKFKISVPLKMAFIALQLLLCAGSLADGGFITWLPVIAAIVYTWYLDLENEIMLKGVMILCQICWLVYDILYLNYVSAAFDIFTMISTSIGIYLIFRDRKIKKQ